MKPVVVPRPKAYPQASGRFVASWGKGLKRQTSHTIRRSWHMMAPDIAFLFPSTVGNHVASSVANLATFTEIVRQKSVQSVVIWQTSMSQLTAHTKVQWLSMPGLANLSLTRQSSAPRAGPSQMQSSTAQVPQSTAGGLSSQAQAALSPVAISAIFCPAESPSGGGRRSYTGARGILLQLTRLSPAVPRAFCLIRVASGCHM